METETKSTNQMKWRIILPVGFFTLAVVVAFGIPMGYLFLGILGLPWSFLSSFINGPLFALFPNLPGEAGFVTAIIVPVLVNIGFAFRWGLKLDKKQSA